MLLLSPSRVSFGALILGNVASIAIDRVPAREVIEFSDAGPYPTFADVPEQKVVITIVQHLTGSDFAAPLPSASATLLIQAKPNASDAGAITLQAGTVVRSVTYDLRGKGATRTITLFALSSNGAANPITIT